METISFYRNHYEIIFKIEFDNEYRNQKVLDIDFGPIFLIEPKYFPIKNDKDSIWTKYPKFPIMLEKFLENCIQSGGGLVFDNENKNNNVSCVFRFVTILPYSTIEVSFKGVGSPLNNIPLNVTPYIKKLKEEWNEQLPYKPIEWKKWKPLILK